MKIIPIHRQTAKVVLVSAVRDVLLVTLSMGLHTCVVEALFSWKFTQTKVAFMK